MDQKLILREEINGSNDIPSFFKQVDLVGAKNKTLDFYFLIAQPNSERESQDMTVQDFS